MSATFHWFDAATEALAEKKIDLGSDTLKIMFTNTAPSASNAVKGDITEISAGHGYSAGGAALTVTSSAQTGGTYKLVANNLTITASGGSIGPFRYPVLYSDTAASKDLIGYWDYGSAYTIPDGNTFEIDFDGANGVLQLVKSS